MNAATPSTGPVLRDIHLPPAPSWWPPAPGWWLLAALTVVLFFFAVRWLLQRLRERRWRRSIRSELERIAATHAAQPDPAHLAMQVSRLLRRATLILEPDAAALSGERWLAFLDERIGSHEFSRGAGRVLLDAPYRRSVNFDAAGLIATTRRWLELALLPSFRTQRGARQRGVRLFRLRSVGGFWRSAPQVGESRAGFQDV